MATFAAGAQSTGTETAAVAGPAEVLSVVRWNGSLPEMAGRAVELRFSLFQDQADGPALWSETQTVRIGGDGRYAVLLGAASAEGLPQGLFQAGQARWIEATPAAEGSDGTREASAVAAPARALLAAVPYALKSADSDTLAGRAAADYVTREDLRSAITAAAPSPAQVDPETGSAITGAGTANYVPVWTGAATLGNSIIAESGTRIGIGTAAPTSTLDVNGSATLNGTVLLPAAAAATAKAGVNSFALEFGASTFSSATRAAVPQNFAWKAVSAGNNSATPTASLELLFGKGTVPPAATGLSIAPTGQISFAAGQAFPGVVKSVTATSPITETTTAGAVSVGLNTASLETTLNVIYPRLSTSNSFKGATNSFAGTVTATSASGSALTGTGTSGATGVTGNSSGGSAVYGTSTNLAEQEAGVLGVGNLESTIFNSYNIYAGMWGDTGTSSTTVSPAWAVGVIGTADDSRAGVFLNNSTSWSTMYVQNYGSGGATGLFRTLMAVSKDGTCGIGGHGDLSCTGQIKSLVSAGGGSRTVETYAMQSPENWMEDFGSAELQRGIAVVNIDPAFAETIAGGAGYHVFITPNGDSKGLYVTRRTATTFEVHESSGGLSTLTFDYRIVARRKGFETQRLKDVTESFKAESATAIERNRAAAKHKPADAPRVTSASLVEH